VADPMIEAEQAFIELTLFPARHGKDLWSFVS
jgi:hypothetical protein